MEGVEFKEEWQDEDFPRFFNLSSDQMSKISCLFLPDILILSLAVFSSNVVVL